MADAAKALAELETKYAKTAWFAAHKDEVEAARQEVKAGIAEAEAEKLYAQAAALFEKQDLWALKPVIEKLEADYAATKPVTDAARKPPFVEMAAAVAKLGKFLTVRKDGKGDFTTIQAAIDAAPPNSLVEIQDAGPYAENLSVETAGLVLRGKSGTWPIICPRARQDVPCIRVSAPPRSSVGIEGLVVAPREVTWPVPCVASAGGRGQTLRLRSMLLCNKGEAPALNPCYDTRAHVENSLILARLGKGIAGGASIYPVVANSIVVGGLSASHGRLRCENAVLGKIEWGGEVMLVRCTIPFGVRKGQSGGNCVIIDSIAEHMTVWRTASSSIRHCTVFGKGGFRGSAKQGKGCLVADPKFRSPKHFDYRLSKNSPCRGRASDGGDMGCRYTPEMLEMLKLAFELRKKGIIKF